MYPPKNENSIERQEKISHLLFIILSHAPNLGEWERNFVLEMGNLLNAVAGLEPATALSEAQSRALRHIIYKHHDSYREVVPDLPVGVSFKGEVRRLLKSQPNPNG